MMKTGKWFGCVLAVGLTVGTFWAMPAQAEAQTVPAVAAVQTFSQSQYKPYEGAAYSLEYATNTDGTVIITGYTGTPKGELVIPDAIAGKKVTDILSYAFSNCTEFTGSLTIPDSVVSIGGYAFVGCTGFNGRLTLGKGVTEIGLCAFSSCSGFTGNLQIPNGVTSIGPSAFYCCAGFTGSLVFPDSLTSIGDSAFYECTGFTGSLRIPDGVTLIQDSTFRGCKGFTGTLTLPDGVTGIEEYAFYDCSGFTGGLRIPAGVTSIGRSAFYGCSGFTGSLVLPTGITSIESSAFSNCSGLTGSLRIPDGVTLIQDSTFRGCTGFTGTLTIPDGVTGIEESAFYDCSGFTGGLRIPAGVTSIGRGAFYGCSGFTGSLSIPNRVTSIGEMAFEGCSGFTGSLTLGTGLTSIGESAFSRCTGLTGSLRIPNGVTNIGLSAFSSCKGFTGSLTIPDSVTSIGKYAFSGCVGFTGSLTIPDSVTSIGQYAFSGCVGFTGDLTLSDNLVTLGDKAFLTTSFSGTLTIGKKLNNLDFIHAQEKITAVAVSSQNPYFASRDGIVYDKDMKTLRICPKGKSGKLNIPAGVTTIGAYSFDGCSKLTGSILLPRGVTLVGEYAFRECTGFDGTLSLPDSLVTIAKGAFCRCENLRGNLNLPAGVKRIEDEAFNWAGLSGGVVLPDGLTYLGNAFYAFGFGGIEIPASVEHINKSALYYSYGPVLFVGHAPSGSDIMGYVVSPKIKAYYPADDSTWTEERRAALGNESTQWIPVERENIPAIQVAVQISAIDWNASNSEQEPKISAAKKNYEALTDSQKAYVSNYGTLLALEQNIRRSKFQFGAEKRYLKPGVYEVPVQVSNGNKNQTSLDLTDSIWRTSLLVEEDGTAVLTIYAQDFTYMGKPAKTSMWWYYAVNEPSLNKYQAWTVQKKDGYPSAFQFELPSQVGNELYMQVETSLIKLDAVLHLDYAKAKTDLDRIEADKVTKKILELDVITLDKEPMVREVRRSFDALTESQQKITLESHKLKYAEFRINCLKYGFGKDQTNVLMPGIHSIDSRVRDRDAEGPQDETPLWLLESRVEVRENSDAFLTIALDGIMGNHGKLIWFTDWKLEGINLTEEKDAQGHTTALRFQIQDRSQEFYYFTAKLDGKPYRIELELSFVFSEDSFWVVFRNWDNEYITDQDYAYGEQIIAPKAPVRKADKTYTYEFTGWDKKVGLCHGAEVFRAQFKPVYINYPVVFKNWDGTILSQKNYHFNDKVTPPANPTRSADKKFTYTFTGWNQKVTNCTGAVTYTAVYSEVPIEYKVEFRDWDGSVLSSKKYHYGDKVTVPENPKRAADKACTYTFKGWNSKVTNCTGAATYTAVYSSVPVNYMVEFRDWDGTLITKKEYPYGTQITAPQAPARKADKTYTYEFTGWDKEVGLCHGAEVFRAQFTSVYIDYPVVFKNWDGTILSQKNYHFNDKVTPPANPTRSPDKEYAYTFTGWDHKVTNCTGAATYTAVYSSALAEYQVEFRDWDGSVLSSKKYHYGDKVTVPENPQRAADNACTYVFKDWGQEVTACTGAATYTAVYTSTYIDYQIVFKNWDGSVLKEWTGHYGDKLEAPAAPVRPDEGYYFFRFAGWTPELTETCTGNAAYTAVYSQHLSLAEGWNQDAGSWLYVKDGEILTHAWMEDSQGWCYLGEDGHMLTNAWVQDSAGWCYLGKDGRVLTNAWMQDSYSWCYLDENGRVTVSAWVQDSQGWCCLGEDGYILTNTWIQDSTGWCYLGEDGRMVRNAWVMDSQGWCYLNDSGYMAADCWAQDSKGWCYLDSTGHLLTNTWMQDSHGWCYLGEDGRMVKNQYVNDTTGPQWIGEDGYVA